VTTVPPPPYKTLAKDAFDQAPSPSFIATVDGLILDANHAALAALGIGREQALGRKASELWAAVAGRDVAASLQSAIEQAAAGATRTLDAPIRASDGSHRTVEWLVRPILDHDGRVSAVSADARDVTDHRRAEHESNLLVRLALAVAHTDSIELALSATLRTVCEAAGWVLGETWIPERGPSPDGDLRLVRAAVWSKRDPRLDSFAAQGEGFSFAIGEGLPGTAWQRRELVWDRRLTESADFTRAPLAAAAGIKAAAAIPIMDNGTVVAVMSLYMADARIDDARLMHVTSAVAAQMGPIIQRKQAEEWSRAAEARLAGIVSIALDAIISIDHTRRITLFNWGAERIFGYSADEAIGQSLDILLPPAIRERHADHVAHFAASAQTARRMGERSAIVGQRKNGEIFPAEASISRYRAGDQWTFTVILRDITDRQRTEDGLRQAVGARDEVLAVVSHDLRNPLSAIRMCISVLREAPMPPPETVAELLDSIHESTDWMSHIIQDLLDVASIDAGRLSIDPRPTPLLPVLSRAESMFAGVAEERGLTLDIDMGGDSAAAARHDVLIDEDRILQVLVNLLQNACKFTPPGGTIRATTTLRPDVVEVAISDTGVGIAPDHTPKVFDRFWHGDRSSSKVRSTGLGLAIARGIVEAHQGRIWVDSTLGQGSTFFFTVPRSKPPLPR
jgi:PAS domain S-box-containing protein